MASGLDPTRAPVAFGRRAVPQLFELLHQPEAEDRLRVLTSLCDVVWDPERLYQTVNGGFLEQLRVLLKDEEPSVRAKTCQLIHLLTAYSIGRQALLASSLLPGLSELLDDSSCRTNVLQVLERLSLLPAGAEALQTLVPVLMLKLDQEEEEEVQVLLLSTLGRCFRLDPLPSLALDGVSLLGRKLSRRSPNVCREAAAALMELSGPEEGKRRVCEEGVLPVLVGLLQDKDIEVQINAAGVVMYTVVITAGKQQCLDLNVLPILLHLLSDRQDQDQDQNQNQNQNQDQERRRRRKTLLLYTLRALSSLAEAPEGRCLLLQQLPLLVRKSEKEEDPDIRRALETTIRVISWTP